MYLCMWPVLFHICQRFSSESRWIIGLMSYRNIIEIVFIVSALNFYYIVNLALQKNVYKEVLYLFICICIEYVVKSLQMAAGL